MTKIVERWNADPVSGLMTRRGRSSIPGGVVFDRASLVAGTYKPGPLTTAPLPGTTFTQGGSSRIVYSSPGPVDAMEYSMRVQCGAKIDFTNCIFHGDPRETAYGSYASVIGTGYQYTDLHGSTFTDCKFDATGGYAHSMKNDIQGGNFTLLRTELIGATDSISIIGRPDLPGVTVQQCWSHQCHWETWAPGTPERPTHADHQTHNDAIQFHRGTGHMIWGNMLGGVRNTVGDPRITEDWSNSCCMIQQEVSADAIENLGIVMVKENWLQGGAAAINFGYKFGNDLSNVTLQDNRFLSQVWYPGQPKTYFILVNTGANPTLIGNVMDDTGLPVPIGSW